MVLKKLLKLSLSKKDKSSDNETIVPKQEQISTEIEAAETSPSDYDPPSNTTSFSSNSTSNSSTNLQSSNIYNSYISLTNNPKIARELVPVITLLNCQNSRIYVQSQVYLNIEYNNSSSNTDLSYVLVDALVKGNHLIIYKQNLESQFKPINIDILESSVNLIPNETSLIISNSNKLAYHLKFTELNQLQAWLGAIKLSIYEYHRLNEAYTASLLSAKGPTLSDLHVVLAESRYETEEWCSIKFGKQGKWVSCYCVITPAEKGTLKKNNVKNGSISFYNSNKTSKKNLICSINTIESCYAVFPHVDLIDESTLLRLNGDLNIYHLDEDLKSNNNRSRSNSVSSSNLNLHKRSESSSSLSSMNNNKNLKSIQINNTSLYILPKPHNGVKSFETLIRYLIPVYDSFQLYGRPKKLNADKLNSDSLLFGLPSLPHVEYLNNEAVNYLIGENWSKITPLETFGSNDSFDFNQLFNNQIKSLYSNNSKHKGFGDLKSTLIKETNFENPMVKFNTYNIPGFESNLNSPISPISPKFTFETADLPMNKTNILKSSSSMQLNQIINNRSRSNSRTNSINNSRFPSSNSNNNLNAYINSRNNSRRTSFNNSISPNPQTQNQNPFINYSNQSNHAAQAAQSAFLKEEIS